MTTTPTSHTKFGKDHWSLLAYLESRCAAGQYGVGVIDFRRIRCNPANHPLQAVNRVPWRSEYGTKLAGFFSFTDHAEARAAGVQLTAHDDWDCIDDLVSAELLTLTSATNGLVKLTPLGVEVCAELSKHKAKGGQFAEFTSPHQMSVLEMSPSLG
jgi:hypothetical protein